MTDTQRKALVVDPDESQGKGIAHALQDYFPKIILTQRPFEAIRLLKENQFDVIITEIEFDLIDGFEAIKNFRELAPQSMLIVVSAHLPEKSRQNFSPFNISNFIEKPLDVARLKKIVITSTT